MQDLERGDVVLVAFMDNIGGQTQVKRRPGVIVSSNELREDAWVVPLTSGVTPKPGCIPINANSPEGKSAGLRFHSLVDCNVIATIPRTLLVTRIGHLGDETMSRIANQLRQNGLG